MNKKTANVKKENLVRNLNNLDSLLVAFSGGVDSTFLLAVAHQVLGSKVLAATATSPTYPFKEQKEALEFTKTRGINHVVFESNEVSFPEFSSNNSNRCYYCKKFLSQELHLIAQQRGLKHIALAVNLDDLNDYRPGIRAAEEMGIIEPLINAKLTKDEIRFLSKEMGLPTWDKPAMACLASRIPYGEPVTEEKLGMVEYAEDFLFQNGLRQCRVRHHGSVARIEVAVCEMEKIMEKKLREEIVQKFKEIGFFHVALDLEGYVTGSLNRPILNA